MKLFSKAVTAERGDLVRVDDFGVRTSYGPTGEVRDDTLDRNQEWFLRATVEMRFWANRAQYADAERIARRAMMHHVYSDVLMEIAQLRSAVSDGDRMKCYAIIDRIDSVLNAD